MIAFQNVSKIYGDRPALDKVSFKIEPGEFVFILGPSGAGKTTIGKLLTHEMMPSEGEVVVGEFELTKMPKKEIATLRQQIGVVFQDYRLLPDRTAGENISLALEIANKSDSTIEKTLPQLLKLIGLQDKDELFPSQLSGGEAQRVVIARALATDPAVLFADEPTGNLDKDNAYVILELLERINQHGTTVIMATHDQEMVKSRKHRVLEFKDGQLIKDTAYKAEAK